MAFVAEILLALLPALLLFAALVQGRYPGERTLARFSASTARPPRRAPARISPAPRAPRALLRSGELIARSLATRPPPALLRA